MPGRVCLGISQRGGRQQKEIEQRESARQQSTLSVIVALVLAFLGTKVPDQQGGRVQRKQGK